MPLSVVQVPELPDAVKVAGIETEMTFAPPEYRRARRWRLDVILAQPPAMLPPPLLPPPLLPPPLLLPPLLPPPPLPPPPLPPPLCGDGDAPPQLSVASPVTVPETVPVPTPDTDPESVTVPVHVAPLSQVSSPCPFTVPVNVVVPETWPVTDTFPEHWLPPCLHTTKPCPLTEPEVCVPVTVPVQLAPPSALGDAAAAASVVLARY